MVRDQARVVCSCFMAALLPGMWNILWHVPVTLISPINRCNFLLLPWKIAGKCDQSAGCRRQPAAILNPEWYLTKDKTLNYLGTLKVHKITEDTMICSHNRTWWPCGNLWLQLNLDYPHLDYLYFSIIWTSFSGPIFSWILISHIHGP